MKKLFKYSMVTCLNILFILFLAMPADAQRGGGGGGGHSGGGGGGGGGGHFSGGGGGSHFSGGGASFHSSAGISSRGGFTPRGGAVQSGFRGNSHAVGFNGAHAYGVNGAHAYGVNGARGFRGNGPGAYGHAGRFGHYGWGRHGGYFFHGGFYGSLYYPWLGFTCGFLPYGYYPFYWNDYPYYFSDGYYYQYNNDEYTVVEPPVGALIKTLPSNAKSIVINGQQYYELNGVYYLPVKMEDGTVQYEIAGKDGQLNTDDNGTTTIVPKIGDIVTKLPPDCRKVTLNGTTLYVSEDGIYYQETRDSNNNKVYKIVGLESDTSDN